VPRLCGSVEYALDALSDDVRKIEILDDGLWNGEHHRRPVGTKVVQVLNLTVDRWLIREDYFRFPPGVSNLYCVDESLETVWSAALPSSDDSYCNDAQVVDGKLLAWTWNCYCCELEASSGQIVAKQFTK
jgi:outer membrane protein assembly factor BamB